MYSAKSNGKRGYAVYEQEMHTPVRRRHDLAAALERAVERGEIGVEYQPIVDLSSGAHGRARGARALVASRRRA